MDVYAWENVTFDDEEFTQEDLDASKDLSFKQPIGKFLCTVESLEGVEKNFASYSCVAARLTFKVQDVLEVEKPIIDDDGQPITRNGEPVLRRQAVEGAEKEKLNNEYGGVTFSDDIPMFNPAEKPAVRKRRFNIAQQLAIIAPGENRLTMSMWPRAVGKQIIITTQLDAKQKKYVNVAFDGYQSPEEYQQVQTQEAEDNDIDLSGI